MSSFALALTLGSALLVVSLWRLLSAPERLVIDERGILARNLRLGWIRWDEIEGAYPPGMEDDGAIRLRLRRSERLLRRLAGSGQRAQEGWLEVRLELAGTGRGAVEILQAILAHGGPRVRCLQE